jgi:S1-C subfamily serine protease
VLSNLQKRAVYDAGLAAKESVAIAHEEEAPAGRAKWFAMGAIVLAGAAWMILKKQAHTEAPPPPITTVAPQIVNVPQQPIRVAAQPNVPAMQLTAEELYAKISPSVARVNVMDENGNLMGTGSAVVIGNGQVITNCHVAKMGPALELSFRSEKAPATVTIADEIYDLCQLSSPGLSAPAVMMADLSEARTGEKVYTIGAPQGLELTISEGIISSLRDMPNMGTVIQTSAAISPGSSGGGLFDSRGRLIGITSFQSRSGQNLNFAVPAEWIKSMTNRSANGTGIGGITMDH